LFRSFTQTADRCGPEGSKLFPLPGLQRKTDINNNTIKF